MCNRCLWQCRLLHYLWRCCLTAHPAVQEKSQESLSCHHLGQHFQEMQCLVVLDCLGPVTARWHYWLHVGHSCCLCCQVAALGLLPWLHCPNFQQGQPSQLPKGPLPEGPLLVTLDLCLRLRQSPLTAAVWAAEKVQEQGLDPTQLAPGFWRSWR